jgi:hypothetical protein
VRAAQEAAVVRGAELGRLQAQPAVREHHGRVGVERVDGLCGARGALVRVRRRRWRGGDGGGGEEARRFARGRLQEQEFGGQRRVCGRGRPVGARGGDGGGG